MIEEITPAFSAALSRSIIHPTAKIAPDVEIGPWCVIGPNVEIDSGTVLASHVVIKKNTRIGKNNKIYQFTSLGEDPIHVDYKGEETWLKIGDNNIIRESSTLNRGTAQGGGQTVIGNNNYIMSYVHIGHDCKVGNNTFFVNNASLAGHVTVEDHVMLGAFVAVHQHCRIGAQTFISHASMITKDVMPYILVVGHDPKVVSLNVVGLRRRNFSEETIKNLKQAFKIIFRNTQPVAEVVAELEKILPQCPEINLFIEGFSTSKRGILR